MTRFYFPHLFWAASLEDDVVAQPFGLHPRRWEVSVFDLYSLVADGHPIQLSVELMQLFLPLVNLEISVAASGHEDAKSYLDVLRAMLYLQGKAPTIAPFSTSFSLNAYAGINARSSSLQRENLPEGLKCGITSQDSRVEGWPAELSFSVLRGRPEQHSNSIEKEAFLSAVDAAVRWKEIEGRNTGAATLRSALVKAPLMPDKATSILHIWQALESVFGKGPELTFRMSLTLAELSGPVASRVATYEDAKKSYRDRSEITHGRASLVDETKWVRAWELLVVALRAILHRGAIPNEDELFLDLLSRRPS